MAQLSRYSLDYLAAVEEKYVTAAVHAVLNNIPNDAPEMVELRERLQQVMMAIADLDDRAQEAASYLPPL